MIHNLQDHASAVFTLDVDQTMLIYVTILNITESGCQIYTERVLLYRTNVIATSSPAYASFSCTFAIFFIYLLYQTNL